MSNENMSRLEVPADLKSRTSDHEFRQPRTLSVKNLRPLDDGSLGVAKRPVCYQSLAGCMPLGVLERKGGRSIVGSAGRSVYTVDESQPSANPVIYLSVLPSEVLCALPQRSGESILVMTAEGAVEIRSTESGVSVSRIERDYPAVMLTSTDGGIVSTEVSARRLSRVYGQTGQLVSQDSKSVTSDLISAYLHLCEEASGAGVMIQPAICRYKLRDINGRELFSSGPVLLSATSGAQLSNPHEVMSDDRQTINAYTVSAETWKLSAVLPSVSAGEWPEVASMDVYMSPLFHPYNPDTEGYTTLARGDSQVSPFLRVSMPGLMYGLGSGYRKSVPRTVRRVLSRLDALERCVATIHRPFGTGGRTVEIAVTQPTDVRTVMREVLGSFKKKVSRQTRAETLMRAPHTLTARVCASDAQMTAWGDLGTVRFKGWNAQSQGIRAEASKSWRTVTVVKFSDGSGVMRSDSGEGNCPTAFSPLLSYPSPDATEMKIVHMCDGRTMTAEVKLEPDESGRFSVWVSESARPQVFDTGGNPATGTLKAPEDRWPDMVAFAPTDSPLRIESNTQGLGGRIKALALRDGTDQSWEFGRQKFVAGTTDGLYSIVLGSDRNKVAVKSMVSGKVESADQLIGGEPGELFALCGNNNERGPALLRLTSRGVFELFECPRDYHALAYEPYRKELWALRNDGTADVFCRAFQWRRYERSGITDQASSHTGGTAWIVTPQGLLRPDREVTSERTEIEVSYDVVPRRLRYVTVGATDIVAEGSNVNLRFEMAATGTGQSRSRQCLDSSITGSLESPVRLYHTGRPMQRMTLKLSGSVSEDFVLNSFRVYIK